MHDEDVEDPAGLQALRNQRETLNQLPTDELLRRSHFALLRELLAKLELGVLSHQEMSILRNMLRDNGMVLGVPPAGQQPGVSQPRDLPTFDDEDYEHK
jgi:hypothetical protein